MQPNNQANQPCCTGNLVSVPPGPVEITKEMVSVTKKSHIVIGISWPRIDGLEQALQAPAGCQQYQSFVAAPTVHH